MMSQPHCSPSTFLSISTALDQSHWGKKRYWQGGVRREPEIRERPCPQILALAAPVFLSEAWDPCGLSISRCALNGPRSVPSRILCVAKKLVKGGSRGNRRRAKAGRKRNNALQTKSWILRWAVRRDLYKGTEVKPSLYSQGEGFVGQGLCAAKRGRLGMLTPAGRWKTSKKITRLRWMN